MTADSNHGFKMIGVGKLVARLLTTGSTPEELKPFALRRYSEGWTYGDRKIRVTVPIRTVYGPAYGLEGLLQNRIIRKDEGGKILELRNDDWRLLFDLNAAEGTTWKLDTSQGEDDLLDGATVTVASRSERVKVPYGKFEKSIHLILRPRPGLADAGITDLWFVPGVGLVKGSEVWIGGSRSFNLTTLKLPIIWLGSLPLAKILRLEDLRKHF